MSAEIIQLPAVNAWPKLGFLLGSQIVCQKCGAVHDRLSITLIPTGAFRADCPACGSFVKWISPRDFSLKEPEPKQDERPQDSWIVSIVSQDGAGTVQEVASVCDTELQAQNAAKQLQALGLETLVEKVKP